MRPRVYRDRTSAIPQWVVAQPGATLTYATWAAALDQANRAATQLQRMTRLRRAWLRTDYPAGVWQPTT
jgi:hypothetical protein